MPEPQFERFVFDDDNEEKFEQHGITARQVAFVVYGFEYQVRRNRNARSGLYLLIGRDSSGTCIAVPVASTDDPLTWRPVTAWYCKPSEAAQLDG